MSTPESKGLTPSSTSTSEAAIRQKVAVEKRRQHRQPRLEGDPMEEEEECDPLTEEEMEPSQTDGAGEEEFLSEGH